MKKKQKNLKRKYLIISIILTFTLILGLNVYAGTQDSTLTRTITSGIYAVAPLSDRTHLYNFEIYTVNNKVAYCIEIGKSITTTTYNSTTNSSEQEQITNLSKEKLNYIKTIAYFGYRYPGHEDKKYYMAAQELIWEYINGIDITWTDELDINGNKINIDFYKNEIMNLVEKYLTPLTINSNISCNVGDSIVLEDSKDIYQFYTVSDVGKGQAQISGTKLDIQTNKKYIGKDKIVLSRKNTYSYLAAIYNSENSQSLLSVGEIENLNYEINLDIKGFSLTTNLIDKDTNSHIPSGQATLTGAVYEIYDSSNNLIEAFKTDETGTNTINNLYPETYYIKQKAPSQGYQKNEDVVEVVVGGSNKEQILIEEVIKNNIEINKLYEFENNNKREVNIKFDIYDDKNNLYTSIITTETGPDIVTLPYGKYIIKQVNTTYGYDKVDDININIDEQSNINIKYTLLDQQIKNKLHITTKDKKTLEKILESGIKYNLIDKKIDKYITMINEKDDEIIEFETNELGELTFSTTLPYGDYILSQVSTPKNYLENTEKIHFTIDDKTEYMYINDEIMVNIDFENEPIIGKINIITNEEIIKQKNNGFEKENDIRKNVKIELYKENELIGTYKTNKNGNLTINNLSLGKYCIKDLETTEEHCMELISEDNKTKVIEETVTSTKKINTTNVIIDNIDESNTPIEGTIIELYQEDKKIITSMTNENGLIIINNVPRGEYCIKETKVSSKYILNLDRQCFEIKDTSIDKNITIINKMRQTQIKVPNTLSTSNISVLILPILLVIFIIKTISHKKSSHE